MGVTKGGRIAVLTNFREDVTPPLSAVSRGAIIKDFLKGTTGSETREWVKEMVQSEKGRDVGGFSLVCGKLAAGTGKPEHEGLAVFSNRVKVEGDVQWILGDGSGSKAVGLSNAAFGEGWKKVLDGQRLMNEALEASQKAEEAEDKLIQRLLGVLSTDTLPRIETGLEGSLDTYINQLRNTILVPAVGKEHEIAYGTRTQTVVLVDRIGKVRYFERTLYDNDISQVPLGKGDRDFIFEIKD